MKEYVLSMVVVCIICIIVKEISPDSNTIKGHINLVCGLCIICVLAYPVCSLVQSISNFDFSSVVTPDRENDKNDEYESIFNNYLCNMQIESIKSEIQQRVANTCNLRNEDVVIYLYTENENGKLCIKRVTVCLFGHAIWADSNKIKETVKSLCDCDVVVAVG